MTHNHRGHLRPPGYLLLHVKTRDCPCPLTELAEFSVPWYAGMRSALSRSVACRLTFLKVSFEEQKFRIPCFLRSPVGAFWVLRGFSCPKVVKTFPVVSRARSFRIHLLGLCFLPKEPACFFPRALCQDSFSGLEGLPLLSQHGLGGRLCARIRPCWW